MTSALVRPPRATAWELRGAWARGLRVVLTIDGDVKRVEGFVATVSPTDAFTVINGLHVPLDRVLAVHRPSRLGDTNYHEGDDWQAPVPPGARRPPGQSSLPGL